MGHLVAHRRWVHLYVNGLYWGIYEFSERINEDFMRGYSSASQQYDVLKQQGDAENGNFAAWGELLNRCASAAGTPASVPIWEHMTEMLDLNNYIDYLLVNMFMNNEDWPHNNWRAARRKDLDNRTDPEHVIYASGANAQRFRFFVWDAEIAMQHSSILADISWVNSGVAQPHGLLLQHPEYQAAWKSRVLQHFDTPGGVFALSAGGAHNTVTRWETEATAFDSAIPCESARWGDGASTSSLPVPAYTRADWLVDKNYKSTTWLPNRRANVRSALEIRHLADPPAP
jgi:CotH kinase protein